MLDKDIRWIGKFGIERETLRVDANGRLAQTKHIFTEDAISRDFCENQVELITPVCDSIEGTLESLKGLSQKVTKKLAENGEYLWLSSNPPYIEGEDEIPIARFDPVHSGKQQYRFNLEQRYGKKLMLYSGVHFNLSFCDAFIGNDKNAFYLKLLKYALKYSWLVTMLTAASPVYDASFDENGAKGSKFTGGASMRNGERGY